MSETVGKRLFLIRAACGEGERDPESIAAFVKRVHRITGAKYQESTISLLERMKQGWRLIDVDNFARTDPLRRGPVWLAYGDSSSEVINRERDASEEKRDVAPSTVHLTRPVSGGRKKGRGRRSG